MLRAERGIARRKLALPIGAHCQRVRPAAADRDGEQVPGDGVVEDVLERIGLGAVQGPDGLGRDTPAPQPHRPPSPDRRCFRGGNPTPEARRRLHQPRPHRDSRVKPDPNVQRLQRGDYGPSLRLAPRISAQPARRDRRATDPLRSPRWR
jgi:hypothetical protein